MYDKLVFGISIASPVDYRSKGRKSCTEMISCDVQNITEHSKWNSVISTENNCLWFNYVKKAVGTLLK